MKLVIVKFSWLCLSCFHFSGDDITTDADVEPVAKDLAKALVQIARGVESKFMKEPLSELFHYVSLE